VRGRSILRYGNLTNKIVGTPLPHPISSGFLLEEG